MRAQQCPGRHIWVCALLVPAQQECKQGRDTVAFSYLISSNQPRRKDNSVSSVAGCACFVAEEGNGAFRR